jgi:hypothetical protein
MELKSIPEQRRTAREHILIMAYEKYQCCREEIQELRMSRDISRSVLSNRQIVSLYNFWHTEKRNIALVNS